MITSVIIRPRNGLVPAATADYSWEAVVNGEVILALNQDDANAKAQARERELRDLPEPPLPYSVEALFGSVDFEDRIRIAALIRETAKGDVSSFFETYPSDMFDIERASIEQRQKLYNRIADWFDGR